MPTGICRFLVEVTFLASLICLRFVIAAQGRCKPNAMELVPIAEGQPVLAAIRLQRYDFSARLSQNHSEFYIRLSQSA
jgi:phosphopantetheinyl transferase